MYIIGQEELAAVARVIHSGHLFRYLDGSEGETDRFERSMREKLGATHFLTTANGTAALICALTGLGIGPGDEVIVPAYTFMSTALAVLGVGAIPVLAEVDESLTIDVADVAAKIGPRTRAVIPVHMHGLPSNLGALTHLAAHRHLAVLEDTCQACGGSYGGRRLGTWGVAGAFSFNQFKIITCGEGGGLVTSDRRVYERALIYHDGGCVFRSHAGDLGESFFAGTNYRVSEIQGALLNVQLRRLDGILARLRRLKHWLAVRLSAAQHFALIPVHDRVGDCGCVIGLNFPTVAERRAFMARVAVSGGPSALYCPMDSGRHVYINWTPIIEGRGHVNPALDPYLRPENRECRREQTRNCCPKTVEILARTAIFPLHLKRNRSYYEQIARAFLTAR